MPDNPLFALMPALRGNAAGDRPPLKALLKGPPKVKVDTNYTSPWLQTLFRSPVADSLYDIAGTPPGMGGEDFGSEMYGMWHPLGGVLLNNDRAQYGEKNAMPSTSTDPRTTLVHEMGHQLDWKEPKLSASSPFALPERAREEQTPRERAARDAVNPYYKAGGQPEGIAQAFNNAFGFLAETAKSPDMDYRARIGALEANTPGMGGIVSHLMDKPTYENHPLRKVFKPRALIDPLGSK